MTAAVLRLHTRTFTSLRKHRNYRLFFVGQVVSLTGTWMQNLALAWYVIELTHSPVAVGLLAFCRFLPFSVFGLAAGVLADRFDNRRMLIVTQGAAMVLSALLATLALTGTARLWQVFVLAALLGSALVFDAPGRHALTFRMVGRDELPNAVALNASLFNASRIIGPSIAGILIAATGVGVAFALNAFSFLAVLTALVAMREEELFPVERAEQAPTLVRGVGEAFAYVRRSRRILMVLLVTVVVSTVGVNFHVLVPVLASETLHAGSVTFGFLSAIFGAGALVGALAAAALGRASWKGLLAGTGGFGVALLALAPQHAFGPAAALLFVTGVSFTLWTANSQAILQLTAPDHLRGRVLSFYLLAFAGTAPLGGLLAGWLADVGGTQLAFGVAGAASLVMTAAAVAVRPLQVRVRAASIAAARDADERIAA